MLEPSEHCARSDAAAGPADARARRVTAFVRLMRANDFRVGLQEAADAVQLAACVATDDARQLRWGLRALLCSNAQDWMRFDELFDRYWQTGAGQRVAIDASGRIEHAAAHAAEHLPPPGAPPGRERGGQVAPAALRVGASRKEAPTSDDFRLAELNGDTHALEHWIEALARRLRKRLVRRYQARRRGRRLHLRRTLRRSLGFGGVPLELVFRERRKDTPRLVLITDVSRSMNVYSYFFLRFARGILDAFRDADAFVFHTGLVHAADALRERKHQRLKEKIAPIAAGWGGGTRIGECLRAFNRQHARRTVDSRTIVVIVSDGYDAGAPELLGEQLRRLRQRARRIIWLNPLLGRADYAPIAGGMQAALPHLDVFAPAHNLESLMRIERLLVGLD